ncbi:cytochrome C biogenesis protein CcmI [Thalassospira sp.]|uniref:tetratricopeptide repeat protein n=1 Tax=Thalassospira sp. TaxID=1912094 RepID=UPI002732C975|nr:cytochrome C biogenesis protein CcmI [Thalassospira sp.]MDP2697351.1 cytochrome C biogenesis protein CcmI [Thalassospira sp.]
MIWVGIGIVALLAVLAVWLACPRPVGYHRLPMILAFMPVLAAGGLYIWLGTPHLPASPYVEREEERNLAVASATDGTTIDTNSQTDLQIRRLLSQIVLTLEVNPRNLQGWIVLARGSLRLGDIDRAMAAYGRAYELSGHNPSLAIEYADTRITAADGKIDAASRDLVLHALGQMPNHYLSRYYYGMMLEQQGDSAIALRVWQDLLRDIPANDPLGAATEAQITALQARMGADE